MSADEVMVSTDPAGCDDRRAGRDRERAADLAGRRGAAYGVVRGQHVSGGPRHHAAGRRELRHTMAGQDRDAAVVFAALGRLLERRDDARTRAPRDVEPRHRVARTRGRVATALGPADDGEEPDALLAQPCPLLAGGELQVGLGPLPGPVILVTIEACGGEPVLTGEVERVADSHTALLGGVDEEEPPERPECLSAQVRA